MHISLEAFLLRRVAVWGYGQEGQAALRFLRGLFPQKKIGVILTPSEAAAWDFSHDPMVEVVAEEIQAGTFGPYQIVIKSPGISPSRYARAMEWAHFRGTRFISGTSMWFAQHRHDKTIAITGTKGKSTTSALTAALLRAGGARTALAGNIGLPLLDLMEPQPEPEYWVIEISSYQAADFGGHPAIATVLNLSPEHLDWHGDEETYYRDKLKLLTAGAADLAVLNAADARLMQRADGVERRTLFNHRGFWHARGAEVWHDEERVIGLADTQLAGAHNASNVAAAFTMVEAFGLDPRSVLRAVREFRPLPHRLAHVGVRAGIRHVDDSIATTPEATLAALRSLAPAPTVVLVGGFDRGLDWGEFARHIAAQPPAGVVAMGQNGARIHARIEETIAALPEERRPALKLVATLDEAVAAAHALVPPGGVVLLSPGAPSFDQFGDYAERGRAFARLAGLEPTEERIEGLGT
ncbi:MAG: UDP-N-acetylmuramoyl-L-alanine--D-glutamate ligase [Xanthomonadales bacterium]|nr:UDP-N-acetylmuramoyl-L-alanine--D-glutamate ligase [Xanthomonadales bacterium]